MDALLPYRDVKHRALESLRKLDGHSERLLDEMSLAGDSVLRRSPVEGAWTPLQTLHHILLAERAGVDYLLYKFGQDDHEVATPAPRTWRTRLNGKLLAAALASPLKFKAPAMTDARREEPGKNLTLDLAAHQLRNCRADLRELLGQLPESWFRGAPFKHAVAGRLSLGDMLLFMRVHHRRHAKQIRRGLAQNAGYYRRQKAG